MLRGPNTNNTLPDLMEVRRRMNSAAYCNDGYSSAKEDVQEDIEYLIKKSTQQENLKAIKKGRSD